MTRFLMVGEKPSRTAYERGWRWEDGKLAAKPLFEALARAGVDPKACWFLNLFGDHPEAEEVAQVLRLRKVFDARLTGFIVVAMGNKVASALPVYDAKIVHPAARGKIRGRDAYRAHVAEVLGPFLAG